MTILQIRNGISAKLDGLYPDIPVYGEEVAQGMERPAFFIIAKSSSGTKELNRRQRAGAEFEIQYFPSESASQNSELYTVGDALYELFRYVDTEDGVLRVKGARYEVKEGILYFYLSFVWFSLIGADDVPQVTDINMEVSNG